MLEEHQKRKIAGQARTLEERFNEKNSDSSGDKPFTPRKLLKEWKQQYPTKSAFDNRLRIENLTEADALEAIRSDLWPNNQPLPEWITVLDELIAYVAKRDISEMDNVYLTSDTPFVELITTIVDYAVDKSVVMNNTHNAPDGVIHWVANRVHSVALRTLYVEFKSFVEYHDPELASETPESIDNPPTVLYEKFIKVMHGEGFRNLCFEYPVLARQIVTLINHGVDFVEDIYDRVETDREELEEIFNISGAITKLEPLTADSHNHGSVPVCISFETGSVIYKPRSIQSDKIFYEVVQGVNEHTPTLHPMIPKYVLREEYGWMEEINAKNTETSEGIRRFYKRAGSLLCLSYLLNITDCHFENIIAHGDSPVIVDCETIFHPDYSNTFLPFRVPSSVFSYLRQSVLFSGLLPWSYSDDRIPTEDDYWQKIAGLAGEGSVVEIEDKHCPTVKAPNTDIMTVSTEPSVIASRTSTPSKEGEYYSADEFVGELVSGFNETYREVKRLHDDGRFFSEIVPQEMINDCRIRVMLRPTGRYDSILQSVRSRDCLRDGVRFSIELEKLAAPLFHEQAKADPPWWLYDAERRALKHLDVPRFESRSDNRQLWHRGLPLDAQVKSSGLQVCRERVAAMDDNDRRRQEQIIRQCFQSDRTPSHPGEPREVSDDQLLELATESFDRVIDSAIETDDGISWVSARGIGRKLTLVPVKTSLYNGQAGIALAAAALYRETGQARYKEIATQSINWVLTSEFDREGELKHGGLMGVGSIIYATSIVSELLDEKQYRNRARSLSKSVCATSVSKDETYDLMKGTAGTMAGLLAHYDRFGGDEVLTRVIACGDHLLANRVSIDGYKVWSTGNDTTATSGFAHGTDGIAYALARLSDATGDERYATAARTGFEYTRQQNDSATRGTSNRNVGGMEWCWGPAGRVLALIGAGRAMEDTSLLQEARSLTDSITKSDLSDYDHLCCGNFGRVESLLSGPKNVDIELNYVSKYAGMCIDRRETDGHFQLPGHSEPFVNPTFFNGLSGIVYTLLRLRHPSVYPSVLLLE